MKGGRGELDAVAGAAQRLAVLLAAGVAPVGAWGYLEQPVLAVRVAAAARAGERVSDALVAAVIEAPSDRAGPAWRGLAAAWRVATEAGAPLAPALRSFAASLRSFAQAARAAEEALAAPVATARMVMVLPAVGVLFGMVLGFNTIATLFTTPIGLGCLALGVALLLGAWRWNRRLVAAAQPRELTPGLRFELMAIAVGGGASLDRAAASVEEALAAAGLDPLADAAEVESVVSLSRRAGVPASELLRSEAEEARRDAASRAAERASVLAVKLMLPLGVCILPAFMLLGVAPLLVTVISSTLGGFPG
ncbi:hypothetical protein EYE40_14485 [Glaciihabitans arcticus]|uniref:Type II secretion system protein GspF domain-containing protein n=1 Tax=Glaciihabitans arcticus TaxID=2668039 RepID=A0A4Q9GRJ2_9MICO|nr:hypothetical protein [Glaciihabitans arcticus]TBN55414.1 hypothetical protein EYE40_14485 [Glaciihabitans arcticus]